MFSFAMVIDQQPLLLLRSGLTYCKYLSLCSTVVITTDNAKHPLLQEFFASKGGTLRIIDTRILGRFVALSGTFSLRLWELDSFLRSKGVTDWSTLVDHATKNAKPDAITFSQDYPLFIAITAGVLFGVYQFVMPAISRLLTSLSNFINTNVISPSSKKRTGNDGNSSQKDEPAAQIPGVSSATSPDKVYAEPSGADLLLSGGPTVLASPTAEDKSNNEAEKHKRKLVYKAA